MHSTKPSTNQTNWKPDLNSDDLEELIDPTNKAEIEENIHVIMSVLSEAKKLRSQAYKFSPSKVKKEKLLKKANKKIEKLKSISSSLSKDNNSLKREIKQFEKSQKEEIPHFPRKKLFKRPNLEKPDDKSILSHEDFNDVDSMVRGLKNFNLKATDEIKNLTKELESDKFNYEM